MTTLHDRCKEFLHQQTMNEMLNGGSPIDDLVAFVVAENGRTGHQSLDQSLPLCLYFANTTDREEFINEFRKAKPNMITKKMP